jgi:hypothetical protein
LAALSRAQAVTPKSGEGREGTIFTETFAGEAEGGGMNLPPIHMNIPRNDSGMSIDDLAALIASDQMVDLHYGDIVTRVYKPDLADARRDVNVQAMSRSYRRAYMAVVEKSLRGFVPKVRLWALNPDSVVKAEADNCYYDMLIYAALKDCA